MTNIKSRPDPEAITNKANPSHGRGSCVLIAEQASDRLSSSVVGVFTLTGAIGILIARVAGGYHFDHWLKSRPFVFIGLIFFFVPIWALLLRRDQSSAT